MDTVEPDPSKYSVFLAMRTPNKLSGTLKYVFLKFSFFFARIDFLVLFLGKRGPPCENINRDPPKNYQKKGLEISKISNIGEVDRIYMASPRGLSGGKTEPPDYILMFSSANVPDITYKINFGICVLHFLKKIFESSTKIIWDLGALPRDVL